MEWKNKERQRLDDWYASTLKFLMNIKDYGNNLEYSEKKIPNNKQREHRCNKNTLFKECRSSNEAVLVPHPPYKYASTSSFTRIHRKHRRTLECVRPDTEWYYLLICTERKEPRRGMGEQKLNTLC
uniref:Uncharacterized protein n=1 Tax=Vespula pensylvanica TaxID=30213 RepID=A0A834NRW7_VESPE|nr:hypothetical protein H0235_011410 [Vespula pensylvanica]